MEVKRQNHEFPPVYDENSEILILGSFPSVKSREMQFFYGKKRDAAAASYRSVGRDRKL